MDEAWYAPASEAIIGEEIDGEVIIVDMGTGRYFTASGAGVALWNRAVAGGSRSEMTEALRRAFPEAAALETDIEGFFGETVEAGLLRLADAPPSPAGAADAIEAGVRYVPPILSCYEDMKDLILIDPIHEVGEAGWPVRASDAEPPLGSEP
jgi:hypothetical protein